MQESDALFFNSFQTTWEASVLSGLPDEKEIYCIIPILQAQKVFLCFHKDQEKSWTKDKLRDL